MYNGCMYIHPNLCTHGRAQSIHLFDLIHAAKIHLPPREVSLHHLIVCERARVRVPRVLATAAVRTIGVSVHGLARLECRLLSHEEL